MDTSAQSSTSCIYLPELVYMKMLSTEKLPEASPTSPQSLPDACAQPVKRHQHRHNVKSRYEFLHTLGKGTYGKVRLARHKDTKQLVAVKTIRKDKVKDSSDMKHIRREMEIMASIQHENIIQIHEVFENQDKIVIVMEYAAGGELYNHLESKRGISDKEAKIFFGQIVSAVRYCHKMGIVHRDLKLENILLSGQQQIKIADFGLANLFKNDSLLHTFCGSPLYASPEIVCGVPYVGPEVDSWSLGVLLYALVYGTMPFDGRDYQVLTKQITSGEFSTPEQRSDAHSLICWMLNVDPRQRATIDDIANHQWLHGALEPLDMSQSTQSPPNASIVPLNELDLNDNVVDAVATGDSVTEVDGKIVSADMALAVSNAQPKGILKRKEDPASSCSRKRASRSETAASEAVLAGQLAAVCGLQARDSLKLKTKPQTASGKRRILRSKRDRESGYYSSPERAPIVTDLATATANSSDSTLHSSTSRAVPHIKSALASTSNPRCVPLRPKAPICATRPPTVPAKECYLMPISPPADERLPSVSSDDASSIGSQTRPASTYSDSSILSSDSFDMCTFSNPLLVQHNVTNAARAVPIEPHLPRDAATPPSNRRTIRPRPLSLSLVPDTLPPLNDASLDELPPSGALTPKSEKLVRDLQRILAPNGRRSGARSARPRVDPEIGARPHSLDSTRSSSLTAMMNQLNADLEVAYQKAYDICVSSAEV